MAEEVRVPIVADTAPFERALNNLTALSQTFGEQLGGALKGAVVNGKSLEDVLRRIGLSLAGMGLEQGLNPLKSLMGNVFGSVFRGIMPFAEGGVVPFAAGGVVSSPTYFPAGRNIGLMVKRGRKLSCRCRERRTGGLGSRLRAGAGELCRWCST